MTAQITSDDEMSNSGGVSPEALRIGFRKILIFVWYVSYDLFLWDEFSHVDFSYEWYFVWISFVIFFECRVFIQGWFFILVYSWTSFSDVTVTNGSQKVARFRTAVALFTSLLQVSRSCAILAASTIVKPQRSLMWPLSRVLGLPQLRFPTTMPRRRVLSRLSCLRTWPRKESWRE